MRLFVLSILAVAVVADRLDNTYLPPGSARTAGGNGNFLNAPFGSGGRAGSPSRNYGAPGFGGRGGQRPSSQYGAPRSGFNNAGAPSSRYGAPSGFGGQSGGNYAGGSAGGFSGGASGNYAGGSAGGYSGGASGNYAGGTSGGRFGGFSQSRDGGAAILRYNNENFGDGTYRFDYETSNGISQNEAGELKNAGSDYESSSVKGSYTYTGDDGQTYTVNYIADENGFQPFGEHIAEISQAVQTSLQKNAAEAQQGNQYNGQGSGNYQQGGGGGGGYQGSGGNYQGPNRPSFNQQTGYQY